MTDTRDKHDWRSRSHVKGARLLTKAVLWLAHVWERIFRQTRHITRLILTDTGSDFMREFAEIAPGTFQHSLQVSNLATDVAKQLGANVLLVRTGALYHDIGKISAPYHYTENQPTGVNPLLKMSNREAAQTVIAHVSEGVKIGKANMLPDSILHFIESHHGTSIARYFYNSEVNKLGQEAVNVDDFRYPGPKPKTREAAILMMADAIEARSRSLNDYSVQCINEMVDDMIDQQVMDGQLSESNLRFSDIAIVKAAFKQSLLRMHHHRIQYPTIHKS